MNKLIVALCLLVAGTSFASAAPPQTEWGIFAVGDEHINVYSYMQPGELMVSPNGEIILAWDGTNFHLIYRDFQIGDLVTGEDRWFRPTFQGAFVKGEPRITGFIDVFPSGDLMVDISINGQAVRMQVSDDGIKSAAGCECPDTSGGHICVRSDCDNVKVDCSGRKKAVCTWTTLVQGRTQK